MNYFLEKNTGTLVMGIINLTPDSFYASSRVPDAAAALDRAAAMIMDGADILDIGAESTRPGSHGVSLQYELDFLIPVIEVIHREFPHIPISVDTRKASVADQAISAGASVINDVSGLQLDSESSEMLRALQRSEAYYVLMHTRETPDVMNANTAYEDFWLELMSFFSDKLALLERANIKRERIILDPGIGFAKRSEHNLSILANLPRLKESGSPLLIGASRKGFLGSVLDDAPAEDRLEATLAISALCAWQDVDIIRVHDVPQNKRVVRMIKAIKDAKPL